MFSSPTSALSVAVPSTPLHAAGRATELPRGGTSRPDTRCLALSPGMLSMHQASNDGGGNSYSKELVLVAKKAMSQTQEDALAVQRCRLEVERSAERAEMSARNAKAAEEAATAAAEAASAAARVTPHLRLTPPHQQGPHDYGHSQPLSLELQPSPQSPQPHHRRAHHHGHSPPALQPSSQSPPSHHHHAHYHGRPPPALQPSPQSARPPQPYQHARSPPAAFTPKILATGTSNTIPTITTARSVKRGAYSTQRTPRRPTGRPSWTRLPAGDST